VDVKSLLPILPSADNDSVACDVRIIDIHDGRVGVGLVTIRIPRYVFYLSNIKEYGRA